MQDQAKELVEVISKHVQILRPQKFVIGNRQFLPNPLAFFQSPQRWEKTERNVQRLQNAKTFTALYSLAMIGGFDRVVVKNLPQMSRNASTGKLPSK